MTTRMHKLELDYDTADAIALTVLKEYHKTVKKMMKDHVKKGDYMHPEDFAFNKATLLPALKVVINQFGG